jgi:hypothetical protein
MYTHCRQFPHFHGASDTEIRAVVAGALSERPHLRRLMRVRNFFMVVAMVLAVYFLNEGTTLGLGRAMVISGGTATGIVLLWNLAWINWVLFPITSDAVDTPDSTRD